MTEESLDSLLEQPAPTDQQLTQETPPQQPIKTDVEEVRSQMTATTRRLTPIFTTRRLNRTREHHMIECKKCHVELAGFTHCPFCHKKLRMKQ